MLIYADFNGLEDCAIDTGTVLLDLTGYGTLASLSHYQLRLRVGQCLLFGDFDSLEVVGEVGFDSARMSNRSSGWYARFSRSDIKHVPPKKHDYSVHVCFKCRSDLRTFLDRVGQNFSETCPYCGTPVMFSLLPPQES